MTNVQPTTPPLEQHEIDGQEFIDNAVLDPETGAYIYTEEPIA